MMTSRERVLTALNHEEPDRVPLFFGTAGELLLRLDTRGYERFVQSEGFGARYTGGLSYAMMSRWLRRKAIDFAAAAGCLKHSIPGDFNLVSFEEVHALAGGAGTGRIQR